MRVLASVTVEILIPEDEWDEMDDNQIEAAICGEAENVMVGMRDYARKLEWELKKEKDLPRSWKIKVEAHESETFGD